VEVNQQVGWGRYRLTVTDPETGAATSMRFRGGWQATAEAGDTPDKVEVSVAQPQYRVGETARVNIKPPFAGELLLTIASDKVFETKTMSIPAEGATLDIKTSADWGTGAYVLASFYRPLGTGRPRDVVRAIGLAWIGLDLSERTLAVAMTLPDVVTPRQRVPVSLKVSGAGSDEPVFLTLAAVDEGILQLTRYASPQPQRYYFGKRRLAVEMRDDYARLLDGKGTVGRIRSGGDGMGGRGLPVVPTKSVALFSGIVPVAADGSVQVPIEIPDFNGQLRLMAVAFSKTRVGGGEAFLTVRDPVIAEVILPRFLAPGDEGRMTLQLHNVDNAAGAYRVRLATSGPLAVDDRERSYDLARDGRKIETIPIRGTTAGIGTISLAVEGPNGFAISRDYSIAVRSPHYPITLEQAALQASNAEFKIDPSLLDAFVPGDVAVALSYSGVRGIDVPGLLQSLDRYPYGCTEQLTSRALPLIYFNDLALLESKPQDKGVPWRVQDAIDKVVQRQDADGSFGLWRVGDGAATPWLQVFATDFLARAKQAGYDVPTEVLARAYKRLQGASYGNEEIDANAYGAYVLARANLADLGELRYLHDQNAPKIDSPLALAHLAGALATMGDRARAASAFDRARTQLGWRAKKDYYQSPLRDAAALVAIAAETRQSDVVQAVVPQLETFGSRAKWTTTQEKSWMLMAAEAMLKGAGPVQLSVNGLSPVSAALPTSFKPSIEQVGRGYAVSNRSQGAVWRSLVLHGTPKDAPPALANGLTIEKKYLTLDGQDADLATVRQNDRLIVSITGRSTRRELIPAVLVDMLPSGFEIEAVLLRGENGDAPYGFLPKMNVTRTREARDDRFVAAF
ncbi:MAG: alpha-2-macroglobulin family protein, partial [Alphaproteobacteria bacterium]|nr:alpha-2-macroglobulin family protein [Alphaproteobacteria bacterium]